MNVTEEFLDLVSLKDITSGNDIKDAVIKCVQQDHQLDLKNLIGIVTDGAPSMIGKNIGAVTLICKHIDDMRQGSNCFDLFICHRFLHLENLCAQTLDMFHVMSIIITTINTIKYNSLKHHQFQKYLRKLESKYSNLIFYAKIRWLSPGKCLLKFWNLKEKNL